MAGASESVRTFAHRHATARCGSGLDSRLGGPRSDRLAQERTGRHRLQLEVARRGVAPAVPLTFKLHNLL